MVISFFPNGVVNEINPPTPIIRTVTEDINDPPGIADGIGFDHFSG